MDDDALVDEMARRFARLITMWEASSA
jgi:myo-inositol catabolism protein IolC